MTQSSSDDVEALREQDIRRARRRIWWWFIAGVSSGILLCVVSFAIATWGPPEWTWWSEFALGVGVSCVLFVLLFILEERIREAMRDRDHLQATREYKRRAEIDAQISRTETEVKREVAGLRKDVERSRAAEATGVAQQPSSPGAQESAKRPDSYTAEEVAMLIERAQARGSMTMEGPRVALPTSAHHVRFVVFRQELGFGRLWLQVEDDGGNFVADECWTDDLDWTEVRVRLQDKLDQELSSTTIRIDEDLIERLMDLIAAADRDPRLHGPAIELFGNDVLLCEGKLVDLRTAGTISYPLDELTSASPERLAPTDLPKLDEAMRVIAEMKTPWLEPRFV